MNAIRVSFFLIIVFFCVTGMAQEAEQPSTEPVTIAPAPAAAPAAAPTDTSCIPQCRAGFMCHAGLCVSKCNPPCGAGYSCSNEGECLAQQPAPAAPIVTASPVQMEREAARAEAREEKMKIKAARLAAVQEFRIAVHMDWQWVFSDLYRTGFVGNIGFQKNVATTFALRARLGGMIGYARPDFFDGGDRTGCWGANIDISPLFGPLGTFYIGPTLWLTYYWHGKDQLEEYDWGYDEVDGYVDTNSGPTGGIALDMGLLVGPTANLGINWRVKTTIIEEFNVTFEFGLAYHFGFSK